MRLERGKKNKHESSINNKQRLQHVCDIYDECLPNFCGTCGCAIAFVENTDKLFEPSCTNVFHCSNAEVEPRRKQRPQRIEGNIKSFLLCSYYSLLGG